MTRKRTGDLALEGGHALIQGEASARLLLRARTGEPEALEELYRRYLMPLQRWSRGRLPRWARDLMDTDDLVQETLTRTLRGIEGFEPRHDGAFQAYLRRGVKNRIRDEIRRVRRRPLPDGSAGGAADDRPSPVEEAIGREALERYEQALDKLKPAVREAVIARVEMGFSYRQIATTLGKPSHDAARMAVSRALAQLAREMADG